jgi:hypothetical protein
MSTPPPTTRRRWVAAITLAQGMAALLILAAELRDRQNARQRHVHLESLNQSHRLPHPT